MARRLVSHVVAGGLVLLSLGCSGDDAERGDDGAVPATTTTFEGDPDSEFCRLVGEARPVPDPFAADIAPAEVEQRLGALRSRFDDFAAVAPPELDDVLSDLTAALGELDGVLREHGYDFERVSDSGADLDAFDDPDFAVASERITAYRQQVCDV